MTSIGHRSSHVAIRLTLLVGAAAAIVSETSLTYAEPVTFRFEGQYIQDQGPTFSALHVGQRVSGHYTFELNTPPDSTPNPNTVTSYANSITNFAVTLDGFGTGSGTEGGIALGDPVQTSGSQVFLSDLYLAYASVAGITIGSTSGERHLTYAQIQMVDLDQVGLDSENLTATPPSLIPFLDEASSAYPSDSADLLLTFDLHFTDGTISYNSATFRLTRLAVIPEPGTIALMLLAATGLFSRRVR